MADLLIPDWPAPARVRAVQTLRGGGCSQAPWDSFNLGDHVGDDPAHVAANRAALLTALLRSTPKIAQNRKNPMRRSAGSPALFAP